MRIRRPIFVFLKHGYSSLCQTNRRDGYTPKAPRPSLQTEVRDRFPTPEARKGQTEPRARGRLKKGALDLGGGCCVGKCDGHMDQRCHDTWLYFTFHRAPNPRRFVFLKISYRTRR
ncbi:hypothetical protein L484_012173 [Morus notabilis]|uniref:Uncharacterized protein n=1 Tax=Morus notabilis TaxID=981085 RepID=W9RJ12_9ROSA|nr:hypothetical protein L484_012173 [Morus notabilis]